MPTHGPFSRLSFRSPGRDVRAQVEALFKPSNGAMIDRIQRAKPGDTVRLQSSSADELRELVVAAARGVPFELVLSDEGQPIAVRILDA